MGKMQNILVMEGNGFPVVAKKILPNDPCPCGSGKKAKKCCKPDTEYFFTKLTDRQKADLKREQEAMEKKKQKELEDTTTEE